MSLTVAQLVARLTADTSGFYRAMAIANSSMIRTGGIISRVAAGAGLATVGMGILSLRAAGNFQESMNILEAVSGAGTKGMNLMRKEAIALGADMKLPNVSAKDAANAMQELAKGGLTVNQILGATRGTLQLGLAANLGFADSATLVARALKAFDLAGTDATRVADLFTAAANKSTAEIGDVALGFQQASARFSSTGQSIEDLATSIAIMADAGVIGSDAGTSLKTMMNRLAAPTKKAKDVMADLGISVYDSSGHFKSMPAIIGSLNKSMKGMSEEQKNAALYTIFGSDAIRAATIMMKEGEKGFNKYKASITAGGEAQAFAEARTKGFNGALQAAGSAVETLAITLGTALLPAATAAVRSFAEWVNSLDPQKIIGFFSAIADVVTTIWDLVAGSDAAQYAIAALVGAFVGFKVISGVIGMINGLKAAWIALNLTFAASPIGMIALALAALAGALVLAYMKSETFKEAVNSAFAAIRDFAIPILNSMKAAITQFFNWIGPYVSTVMKAVEGFFRTHWGSISKVLETYFDIMETIITTAFGIWKATIGAALSFIIGLFRTHWNTISTVVSTAFSIIKGIVTGGIAAIKAVIATISAIVGVVRGVFTQVENAVRNPMETVKTIVRTAIAALPGIISGLAGEIGNAAWALGRSIATGIVNGIAGLAGELAGAVTGAIGGAFNSAKGWLLSRSPSQRAADELGKPIGEGIIQGFLKGNADLPEKMSESLKKALEAGKKQVEAYQAQYSEAFSRLSSSAMSAFDAMTQKHLTPSEAKLAAMDAKDAAAARAQNLKDAQTKFAELTQAQVDYKQKESETEAEYNARIAAEEKELQQQRLEAYKAVGEAEREIQRFHLEQKAAKERLEYDAARALQKQHLEDRLGDLEASLKQHPEKHDFYQKKIIALLKSYGISYKSAGLTLGKAFAKGMEESFDEVEKTAKAIAALVAKYLKVKSPTDKGPMSDLDHWWDNFASTLVKGIDPRVIERASAAAAGGARGIVGTLPAMGAISPAMGAGLAGAGGHVVNYNEFNFGNYVGDRQELISTITTEIQRITGRN